MKAIFLLPLEVVRKGCLQQWREEGLSQLWTRVRGFDCMRTSAIQ